MSMGDVATRARARKRSWLWAAAVGAFVLTAAVAWSRVGVLDLPDVPPGLTLTDTGLTALDKLEALDDFLHGRTSADELGRAGVSTETVAGARLVREGLETIREGDAEGGLETIRKGIRRAEPNLALCNAYRMAIFELQRNFLQRSHARGVLAPPFPSHLDNQPMVFFEAMIAQRDAREYRLNLALAWVDRMLLFPALEIKAPSSVEAVDILTALIEDGNRAYVPALFARGLNHLHRPARLVWPESESAPLDAAARDIGLCVAIGREFRTGSARLQATLAVALGDAYVKAGRLGVARSWWQIAQNLAKDPGIHDAVRRRYGWSDADALDELERELDRTRSALDRPMTDLAMMWN